MSTIIFNDASELSVQQVKCERGYLKILSLVTPAQLREYFEDPIKTKKLQVKEKGQITAEYEGYTELYRIEWYPGNIYGVTVYKPSKIPETEKEVQQAAVLMAQMQAQSLPDAQALRVKPLYKKWEDDPKGYEYSADNPDDRRRIYNGGLWNLNKEHEKQENWYPGADPTLWTEIVEGSAGTKEDPIPIPDSVTTSGIEYEYGKYYSEGGKIYLMNRQGMVCGDKVILYFSPSVLVGQYFQLVE